MIPITFLKSVYCLLSYSDPFSHPLDGMNFASESIHPATYSEMGTAIEPGDFSIKSHKFTIRSIGLGGLGVTCSPRDPRFAGSNPAEVDGFY